MVDKHPNAPRGHLDGDRWPKFRYGPGGQSQVFQSATDVPEGWASHPSLVGAAQVEKTISILDAPPNSELTRQQVMAALKAKGIAFRPTLTTALLRECLDEAEAAE